MAVEIKGQMTDFLYGVGINILELGLAEQEITQVEKVWDTEQSRQSQKQMQKRMKCSVYLETGRSEVCWEHMACRGEWQEILLEEHLGPKCQGLSVLC